MFYEENIFIYCYLIIIIYLTRIFFFLNKGNKTNDIYIIKGKIV